MNDPLLSVWEEISGHLRPLISEDAYERWFSAAKLLSASDKKVVLGVPNNIYQLWIETNYIEQLKAAVMTMIGTSPEIEFVVGKHQREETKGEDSSKGEVAARADSQNTPPKASELSEAKPPVHSRQNASASETQSLTSGISGMNPRNTFESFVVGTNNQFAHAACLAVAQAPGRTYNPLFIYGGVGLGKTHLMQAIGHHILPRTKSSRVIYVSSEKFTNDFIDAIQNGTLMKFRKRYRQADVLLIDDIQFLAGKERSQEEFFHTFNTLFDGHKQIVMSSDRPASEIAKLESRLVSRFEWGMTTELQPPDMETRIAILRKKASSMNVVIDGSIIEFLAHRIRSNVRRLEGALVRVASLTSLGRMDANIETLEFLLKDILQEEAKRSVTIDQIQRRVAERFDIRIADMTSKRRPSNIAFPRQIAMYLARELTKSSLTEIGEAFGGRDHGTVIHAHKLVKSKVNSEEQIRQIVAQIESQLQR